MMIMMISLGFFFKTLPIFMIMMISRGLWKITSLPNDDD